MTLTRRTSLVIERPAVSLSAARAAQNSKYTIKLAAASLYIISRAGATRAYAVTRYFD